MAVREKELMASVEEKIIELDKKLHCADAGSFHLQGNAMQDAGYPDLAINSYCDAADGYFDGDDELNGKKMVKQVIDVCLPKLNKDHFDDGDVERKINELVSKLTEISVNGRYQDEISCLNRGVREAKRRESVDDIAAEHA